jgi:hypothetical protein
MRPILICQRGPRDTREKTRRIRKDPRSSKNSREFFSSLGIGEVIDLYELKGGGVIAGHQTHDDEKNVSTFFEPTFRF